MDGAPAPTPPFGTVLWGELLRRGGGGVDDTDQEGAAGCSEGGGNSRQISIASFTDWNKNKADPAQTGRQSGWGYGNLYGGIWIRWRCMMACKTRGAAGNTCRQPRLCVCVFVCTPPPCKNNAVIRTTVGIVSTSFGIVSYFALYKDTHPLSEQQQMSCPSNFGT